SVFFSEPFIPIFGKIIITYISYKLWQNTQPTEQIILYAQVFENSQNGIALGVIRYSGLIQNNRIGSFIHPNMLQNFLPNIRLQRGKNIQILLVFFRSEERRVGKECRYG